jgi:hypothetical protein
MCRISTVRSLVTNIRNLKRKVGKKTFVLVLKYQLEQKTHDFTSNS